MFLSMIYTFANGFSGRGISAAGKNLVIAIATE
jgi:hypothetical protein